MPEGCVTPHMLHVPTIAQVYVILVNFVSAAFIDICVVMAAM